MNLLALPLDRCLNVIWHAMLQRIPEHDGKRNYRAELEQAFGVPLWASPLSRKVPQIPVEGPWWWLGEEEATDSFLSSMGVHLDP